MIDYKKYITLESSKRSGQPCVRGLRITVYDVLNMLANEMTFAEIMDDFPELRTEDILACLAYAADKERRTATEQNVDWAHQLIKAQQLVAQYIPAEQDLVAELLDDRQQALHDE